MNNICNGKTPIPRCKAETVYKLAKALDTTVDFLIEADESNRCTFENFKSTMCHKLKNSDTDVEFVMDILRRDSPHVYFERGLYPEAFYVLAMVDYLSKENNVPICSDYDDIRRHKLKDILWAQDTVLQCAVFGNDEPKEKVLAEAIPEFLKYNIVEVSIRDAM